MMRKDGVSNGPLTSGPLGKYKNFKKKTDIHYTDGAWKNAPFSFLLSKHFFHLIFCAGGAENKHATKTTCK